jgi:hypothetical protein
MDDSAILDELLEILLQTGIPVRHEEMGGAGGGLCELTGKQVCFIDTDSGPIHNVAVCAEAINKLVDIELIYMKPQVREFLTQTQPF